MVAKFCFLGSEKMSESTKAVILILQSPLFPERSNLIESLVSGNVKSGTG